MMQTWPQGLGRRRILLPLALCLMFLVQYAVSLHGWASTRGPLLFHKCGVKRWLGKVSLFICNLADLGCHWWIVQMMGCALHVILLALQLHLHIRNVVKELPFGAFAHQRECAMFQI